MISALLAFLCLSDGLLAQHASCDGQRYLEEVFPDVTMTSGVSYAQGTTVGGNNANLAMDIYEPQGDTEQERPVIIFAHGGSFIGGNRGNMDFYCDYYAKRGFVTATISYRLYDILGINDTMDMIEEVIMAVGDGKAAVRFFREDAATANQYRIDPDLIFFGGISAGGLLASHVGMWDGDDTTPDYMQTLVDMHGGINGNSSPNTQYSSEVQGVLNFSGALARASFIDAADPPCFSVHDDGDDVVPYGTTIQQFFPGFGVLLEGSNSMKMQADAVGSYHELITIENSNEHVSYFTGLAPPGYQDSVLNGAARFLYDIVCDGFSTSLDPDLAENGIRIYPNPASDQVQIEVQNNNAAFNVSIYNMMGAKVYEAHNQRDRSLTVDRNGLDAGLYIVRIRFDDAKGTTADYKLIFN